LLFEALGEKGVVLFGSGTRLDPTISLEGLEGTLALKTLRGDKTLDLGCLGSGFLSLLLNAATDDVLTDIIFLGQVEESSDLGGSLGSETTGLDGIGESFNFVLSLLDDDKVEDGKVGSDDATADGLTLAFTSLALTVT